MNKEQKIDLAKIIITIIFSLLISLSNISNSNLKFLLYLIPYFIIGYDVLKKAIKGIINLQPFDENLLMMVATIGAIVLSYIKKEDYLEAIAVMLFYNIGELFQDYAVNKSRDNILNLIDICPEYATIENEKGELIKVNPNELKVGSIIYVSPGEKVAIDGVVLNGKSSLNMSSLTGESVPYPIKEGDEALSGSININGVLKIKTTKAFSDSTAYKILELIEDAGEKKAKAELFITKFSRIYTPIVVAFALVVAFLVPSIIYLYSKELTFSTWVYRALTFLVISCPCALMVSVPLSFFAGIGSISKNGVLVKGSNYLEKLSEVKTVVFDKTGTLTKGLFLVSSVHSDNEAEQRILHMASHGERYSTHPIAVALKKAFQSDNDGCEVKSIEEIPGKGIKAIINDKTVYLGNKELMNDIGLSIKECNDDDGTIVHLAIDKEYSGHILVSDVLKETSKASVRALKEAGVKRIIVLTGDNKRTAEIITKELGITEFISNLLPNEKVKNFEKILNEKENKNDAVAFVGDGINDAPVLTRSDVGIAMGAMGSDAAIEAADIVLMDDDPLKISYAIHVAKKCLKIVKENIWCSIGVKILVLLLGTIGIANMWAAVFADVGVMVIAVLNSIRCLTASKKYMD